jgi:hypothetical protein
MVEMVAFGAIAEIVLSLVLIFFDGPVKEVPGLLDLISYFRQIDEAERGTMFVNEMFQGNPMEGQVSFPQVKSFLGEIIGLLD